MAVSLAEDVVVAATQHASHGDLHFHLPSQSPSPTQVPQTAFFGQQFPSLRSYSTPTQSPPHRLKHSSMLRTPFWHPEASIVPVMSHPEFPPCQLYFGEYGWQLLDERHLHLVGAGVGAGVGRGIGAGVGCGVGAGVGKGMLKHPSLIR